MRTKTIKTPLMTAESDALSYWPVTIVPERKCSHMATAHYGFILKLSHHEWQKQKKQFVRYPMFCTTEMVFIVFASNDVFSCEARGDDGRVCGSKLAYRHKAMTAARKLEERKHQCYYGFCLKHIMSINGPLIDHQLSGHLT